MKQFVDKSVKIPSNKEVIIENETDSPNDVKKDQFRDEIKNQNTAHVTFSIMFYYTPEFRQDVPNIKEFIVEAVTKLNEGSPRKLLQDTCNFNFFLQDSQIAIFQSLLWYYVPKKQILVRRTLDGTTLNTSEKTKEQ